MSELKETGENTSIENTEVKVIDLKFEYLKIFNKFNRLKNYDKEGFIYNLRQWIDDLYFFYNCIAVRADSLENAQKIKYDLPKKKRPKEGQIAYFNIGRGYPKELYDGHWCYILKDLGNNFIVIPTTSIKPDNPNIDETKEMKIKIKDFEEDGESRLRINHIKSIDIMRIHKEHAIYDVETDNEIIKENVKRILFNNIDNNK